MKSNDERLQEILSRLDTLAYIKPERIPDIDLYMDQVTTFMDEHLQNAKRYPTDKILTKTMINNYAKNNLLPPPIKKKYSRQHILLLTFIYYFKNMLSFNDIEELFRPITDGHFEASDELSLQDVYKEIFSLEKEQMERLKEDMQSKYDLAKQTFPTQTGDDQEYLQLFAFICELGFDVYLKKQTMELLIDQIRTETSEQDHPKKK
ncbi:MAG: DUF1836 domain-containing protein [Hungatella sp.]